MIKSMLLFLARCFDETAYKCLGCNLIKSNPMDYVIFHHGWVCSERCKRAVLDSSENDIAMLDFRVIVNPYYGVPSVRLSISNGYARSLSCSCYGVSASGYNPAAWSQFYGLMYSSVMSIRADGYISNKSKSWNISR